MKISINWLKEYVHTASNPVEISENITKLGLEEEKNEMKMILLRLKKKTYELRRIIYDLFASFICSVQMAFTLLLWTRQ